MLACKNIVNTDEIEPCRIKKELDFSYILNEISFSLFELLSIQKLQLEGVLDEYEGFTINRFYRQKHDLILKNSQKNFVDISPFIKSRLSSVHSDDTKNGDFALMKSPINPSWLFAFRTKCEMGAFWLGKLPKSFNIAKIIIINRPYAKERAKNLCVYLSDDGKNYTQIPADWDYEMECMEVFVNKSAKYIKLALSDTNSLHLLKIRVYAKKKFAFPLLKSLVVFTRFYRRKKEKLNRSIKKRWNQHLK